MSARWCDFGWLRNLPFRHKPPVYPLQDLLRVAECELFAAADALDAHGDRYSAENKRKIANKLRAHRTTPPTRKLDPYLDCTCTVVRSANRDSFARREHNPHCVYHTTTTPPEQGPSDD